MQLPLTSLIRFGKDQRGATAMVVAIVFTALFTMLAAAVDTSRLMLARNKLQSALDAAAIAAVRDANTQNVSQEVTKFFNANFPSGYMGMTPGNISVSISGNTYTFTLSSNLPQSMIPALGIGSGSNTITVTSTIVAGGGGGPATELVLVLDNSSDMNQNIAANVRKLDMLKAAIGVPGGYVATPAGQITLQSLMDRLAGKNAYISMVNFSDAIRVDPTISNSWLQNPYSTTRPHLSNQSSNNYGRFDGCLSTKYNENNSNYPWSNTNTYLTNDDLAPTSTKFRQYIGPVDFTYYYLSTLYQNYEYDYYTVTRTINYLTNPPSYSNPITSPTRHQILFGYDAETGTMNSGQLITPRHYGAIGIHDEMWTPYTYTQTTRSLLTGQEQVTHYNIREQYNPTMYVYRAEHPNFSFPATGSMQNYNFLHTTAYNYVWQQVEDRRPTPTRHEVAAQTNKTYTRTIDFGGSYVYALKVYMGYKPISHAGFVTWDGYNDAGVRVAAGSAPVTATPGGSQSSGTSYMAEIAFPTPFQPFAKVVLTYPKFGGYNGQCEATPYYEYCQECHRNPYTGKYRCQYCNSGNCNNYQDLANVFDNYYGSYQSFDYHYIRAHLHHASLFTTCGNIVTSSFMQTDPQTIKAATANLVASGPARINIGLNWGWRALSPNWRGRFNTSTQVSQLPTNYNTGNTKIAVLVTQGSNFKNNAKTLNNSNGTYFDDNSLATICTNMKNKGIRLFVLGLGVMDSTTQNRLRNCATSSQDFTNVTSTSTGQLNNLSSFLGRIADSVSSSGSGSLHFGN